MFLYTVIHSKYTADPIRKTIRLNFEVIIFLNVGYLRDFLIFFVKHTSIQPLFTRSKWNMGEMVETIFGLKMMMKIGLEKIFLKFLHVHYKIS